ncbi:MAG: hypothetical protein UDM12_02615 [Prevotellamassilia sp.]|nr:hypothetical protein [Prevotellamassilia sp.]
MKKFTSLILMLMLVFSGSISAQTLITSLDQLSNHHAYYLKCARGYAYSAANHGQLVASAKDAKPNGDDYKFVIYKDADNYYLYNLGAGFFCKKNGDNVGFSVNKLENVTFEQGADATYPWTIFINSGGNKKRFNHNNQGGLAVNYETVDAGNQWQIIDAGETGITELPKIVTDIATLSSSKKYILTTIRGALYGNGNGNEMKVSGTNPFVNDNYCFAPYKDNDGKYYLYNVGGNSFLRKSDNTAKLELGLEQAEITFGAATGKVDDIANYPHTISVDGKFINHSSGWVNTNYQTPDAGNRWMIVEVGNADETAVGNRFVEAKTALLNRAKSIANTCMQNNADYEGNAALQSAVTSIVYESTDCYAQVLAKIENLKKAVVAYNVKAPVKYLSDLDGLPGTGYNDETDVDKNGNKAYRYKWNSETLSFPTPVKKLRFKVLETNTKGASNGHQFFSIGEFRVLDASGNEVSLSAENFVTNAQESTEGALSNICDKKTSTFFHSTWSANTYEDHFIQIELPEEMSQLKLSFDSRNGNNVPTLVVLSNVTTANEQAELKALIDEALSSPIYVSYKNANLIGSGLNQTTSFTAFSKAGEVYAKGEAATSAEIASARFALLNARNAAVVLNKPANGTFIRIHSSAASQAAMPYLSSETSTAKPNRAAYLVGKDGENEAKTIFFYNGNKLLAYETGYYLENISNFAGYKGITTGTSIQFSEAANRAAGCYNVKFNGNRFLYTQVSGSNYFTDAANSASSDGYNFQMEYVESLPLSVGAAGYATLIAPVALEIPAGVEVYTVAFEDGKAKLTSISDVIPANVGVVVKAAQGTYNFNITTTENVATSALSGVPNTENVASESAAFILANGKHGVGFYKLSSANRTIHGFRAFYTAPAEAQAVSAFLLEDNVTGIEEIETSADKAPIYDLSGRRVAKAEKGVYIQNGRKIFVK